MVKRDLWFRINPLVPSPRLPGNAHASSFFFLPTGIAPRWPTIHLMRRHPPNPSIHQHNPSPQSPSYGAPEYTQYNPQIFIRAIKILRSPNRMILQDNFLLSLLSLFFTGKEGTICDYTQYHEGIPWHAGPPAARCPLLSETIREYPGTGRERNAGHDDMPSPG